MNNKWIKIIGIFAVVSVIGLMVVGMAVSAQGPAPVNPANTPADSFVDTDGDGVCDNMGTELQGQQNRQNQALNAGGQGENGQQGQQGQRNQAQLMTCDGVDGENFVDVDGDGVCDNMGSGAQGRQMKNGKQGNQSQGQQGGQRGQGRSMNNGQQGQGQVW